MKFNEDWTAHVVGRMHKYRIRNPELAKRAGYHPSYLSIVLNGGKELSGDHTKENILSALNAIIAEREAGYGPEEYGSDENS